MADASKRLAGQVVLVTGSSRGIGAAIALRFAKEGANVVVNYVKSVKEAEEVVAEIKKLGVDAIAVQADTAQPSAITALFAAVDKKFGKLDVLVNNAAIMKRGMLDEITVQDIDEHLNINIRGYLLCAQAAARMMTKGGCIIDISSAISRMAYPGALVYTATKGAIDVITRVLAMELGPKGIRVNTVAPGSTITDMNGPKSGKTNAEAKQEIAMTALGRQGEPDDIADATVFFATTDARWVTGANLDVSGGIRL